MVVTIVILVILAAVTITATIGDNSILNKATQLGENYYYASVKERLELKLLDLQGKKSGEATWQDLKQLEITDSEIKRVKLNQEENPTQALVWMDKYTFIVGNLFEVIEGYVTKDSIEDFKPEISMIGAQTFTITVSATSKEGEIASYQFYINGKLEIEKEEPTLIKEDAKPDTTYEIYVVAIDESGNTKQSESVQIKTEAELLFTEEILRSGSTYGSVIVTQGNLEGTAGLSITGTSSASTNASDYSYNMRWYKNFDITDFTKLTFYAKKGADHGCIYVYIDGVEIMQWTYTKCPTEWYKFEIDLSSYTGIHEIGLVGGYVDKTGHADSNTQYCNIRLTK